ncbi:TIGR01777 family oxidoreductase [Occallatibacter savannae]|uniref:TIGR01777 family oxidoreductase n=1 Tax=Occallatibacter savannae TaxID=1002691 RepID=UPI001EF64541|nr:TIGR01777 family oxidoreductase [Occallatibacter savannae]
MNLVERPLRIVIPGGSGQVGRVLARYFSQRGHQVIVLTRGPHTAEWQTVHWDAETPGIWTQYLDGADVCINLAGRSVNCRYTPDNRIDIYNSRIVSTRLLGEVIGSLAHPPRLWLNASTATIYRHALDRPMDEHTGELGGNEPHVPDTWRFSIRVAKDWETAFFNAPTPLTRKVAMRSAITLSPVPGNAFAVLSNLARLGLGGTQGNGRQWVSWIHEDDFARAVEFLIARDDLHGPINIASPNPERNRDFMAILREAWDMPNGIPAPRPILELAALLMRTETELVLKSRRVVPARLLEAGFRFEFPNWPHAAEDLVQKWRLRD